ncbi:MAG: TetR/AcrR family transcriptional regulator [Bacteroidota bacterium]
MRPQKINDHQLFASLLTTFRNKGYDGASLNDLAAGAGLKKASLYHRFPGGKEEIARKVLENARSWGGKNIAAILQDKTLPANQRLEAGLKSIDDFYKGGKESCLLRALSMENGLQLFQDEIARSMQAWIDAFSQLGEDLGFSPEVAVQKARQTLILIQGSLVVAKGLQQPDVFTNALQQIRQSFTLKSK